jgi:predicted S18 family serine protease
MQSYHTKRDGPLTPEEIKGKYEETLGEMKEVLDWKKEEETKIKKDRFKTHQAKSAAKRNLKKANRRVDSVKGMIDYWKNRINGMSHFRASIELNEYWASLREKAEKKKEDEAEKEAKAKLPRLLKGK